MKVLNLVVTSLFINVLYPIGMLLINERIASSLAIGDPAMDNYFNNVLNVWICFMTLSLSFILIICNLSSRNTLVTTSLNSSIFFNSTQAPWVELKDWMCDITELSTMLFRIVRLKVSLPSQWRRLPTPIYGNGWTSTFLWVVVGGIGLNLVLSTKF